MSQLRENLQAARADYQSVTYEGDLAAEVLPRPNWRRWALLTGGFGTGSLAAAASIVLAMTHFALPSPAVRPTAADALARVTDNRFTALPLAGLPKDLSHLGDVLPYEKLRSTLHDLGLPVNPSTSDDAPPRQDRDAAAA